MATLDEDPRSKSNEIEKSYRMDESNKLEPWPRRSKTQKGKLRLNLHCTFQTKKTRANMKAHDLKNKAKLKSRV
jgi:hypothetical protein